MSGLLLVTLTSVVLIGATIVLFRRARAASRGGGDGLASRAQTQRYLAQNWTMVEQTARESGMTEEEIARVRANVLGAIE